MLKIHPEANVEATHARLNTDTGARAYRAGPKSINERKYEWPGVDQETTEMRMHARAYAPRVEWQNGNVDLHE